MKVYVCYGIDSHAGPRRPACAFRAEALAEGWVKDKEGKNKTNGWRDFGFPDWYEYEEVEVLDEIPV